MMDLYAHFSQSLSQHPARHYVLALSGGVDSRVMLELLARYRAQHGTLISAVHVHHGLSTNADEWAEQCQAWCDALAVPLCVERVNFETGQGDSIEQLARQARYAALSGHIDQHSCLLLGQHSDDQLETFLLALKRGSGPKGLASMPRSAAFGQGRLLRPLLTVARSDIEAFAAQQQLAWVEDESNLDTRYERNFLRHEVTPLLTQRWPAIRQAVQRSAELCAEQEGVLAELLTDALQQALHADGSLAIDSLTRHSAAVRRQLLRAWLNRHELNMPSRIQTDIIWHEVAQAEQDANPKLKLGLYDIRRFNRRLYCVGQQADVSAWGRQIKPDQVLDLPDDIGQLVLRVTPGGNLRIPAEPEHLRVIFEPQGLSACPVGRAGSRKLKKLFQEYQIPSWQRRRIPILMYQQQVVAVAGLFVERDFSGSDGELIWQQ
ncbi:tRNA lysidine(34) synthetase TilS [Vibrio sp. CDRSL-10 TSBA]